MSIKDNPFRQLSTRAAIMFNYWLMAADVLGKIGPGLNIDVIRTSREIVAVLSECMAQENLPSARKVLHAKKLGQWP